MKGQVIRVISGYYDIYSNEQVYRTRGSGKLRNLGQSPVVGDWVEFTESGLVESIYPRKNMLIRPKVANVDQAIIVTSVKEPNFSSFLLDKMLALVEFNDIKPIIVITKIDLSSENIYQSYIHDGYNVIAVANNNFEHEKFSNLFKNKLTVFMGQTGVGKSSLINNLSNSTRETQAISKALGRGKHTTRVVEIVEWNQGMIIDTPGFSSFEIPLSKIELSKSFSKFKELSTKCRFSKNCLHDKEEDCEIKRAVNENIISKERYNNYIKLLGEIK